MANTTQGARKRITKPLITHESYVQAIYGVALDTLRKARDFEGYRALEAIKLTYGAGPDNVRGITYYRRWKAACGCAGADKGKHGAKCGGSEAVPFVAICATAQESPVQVCGTTLHELGHVLAGMGAGHGPLWHASCAKLGLVDVQAAGTAYTWENFAPEVRARLQALPVPTEGQPVSPLGAAVGAPIGPWGSPLTLPRLRPCGAGFGTRGGQSRGKGSGSRSLLYHCGCPKPRKVRYCGTDLRAKCLDCGKAFKLQADSLPPAHGGGAKGAVRGAGSKAGAAQGQGKGQGVPRGQGKGLRRPQPKPQRCRVSPAAAMATLGLTPQAASAAVNAPLSGPVSATHGGPEDPMPF